MGLVGRTRERQRLLDYAEAAESHFVVVYGRRRVGKTFLVRQTLGDRLTFSFTGLADQPRRRQLAEFSSALVEAGQPPGPPPTDWFEAFARLRRVVAQAPAEKKKIVFLDEMPWMDTRGSGFVSALEGFWNGWASARADVLLIACGSAAAWIARKLFRARGGLYNRVTGRLWLRPFTLGECEELFADRGLAMSRQDQVESYMVFGGIPYYLTLLAPGLGLPQNIDRLCFARQAPLADELSALYASVFSEPGHHERVVRALAGHGQGMSRGDLTTAVGQAGGALSTVLEELERSDFIRSYRPFGRKRRGTLYQLTDPFSRFALRFLDPPPGNERYWTDGIGSGARNAWAGNAFEQVCLAHEAQVRRALGISGVQTEVSSWRSRTQPGAQIDLVIDRADRVVNLCEAKYSDHEYAITPAYEQRLRERRGQFVAETATRKAVWNTLLTTHGLVPNAQASAVQATVTMTDLFGPA